MTVREEAHSLIEKLPDGELPVINQVLRRFIAPAGDEASPEAEAERLARIDAACGALSHVPGSVDDFLAQKREEVEREEARYRQRHGDAS